MPVARRRPKASGNVWPARGPGVLQIEGGRSRGLTVGYTALAVVLVPVTVPRAAAGALHSDDDRWCLHSRSCGDRRAIGKLLSTCAPVRSLLLSK